MKKIVCIILAGMITQNAIAKIGLMDGLRIATEVDQFQTMLTKKVLQNLANDVTKSFVACKSKKGQATVNCLSDALVKLRLLVATINKGFLKKGALVFDLANLAGKNTASKITGFSLQLGRIGASITELAVLLNPKNAAKLKKKAPKNPLKLDQKELSKLDDQLDKDLKNLEDDL